MENSILTLFARTPVHVGAGNSVGVVDSPVMRERHTRIPIIPGSSLKGVMRDLFASKPDEVCWLFGNDQSEKDKEKIRAGALLIGEARVLAFPVRSAKGGFAWITCPLALQRYERDAGIDVKSEMFDGLEEEQCYGAEDVLLGENVVLEEYCLKSQGLTEDLASELVKILPGDKLWQSAETRLVVISDTMFSYFVEHACEVVSRIRIDDETGVVAKGALFNQENVPSETLFYSVIAAQTEKKKGDGKRTAKEALEALKNTLKEEKVIQVGGDETIGLGYCSVSLEGGE